MDSHRLPQVYFVGGYAIRVRLVTPLPELSSMTLTRRSVQVVSMLVNGLLGVRVNAFFHGDPRGKHGFVATPAT